MNNQVLEALELDYSWYSCDFDLMLTGEFKRRTFWLFALVHSSRSGMSTLGTAGGPESLNCCSRLSACIETAVYNARAYQGLSVFLGSTERRA